MLYQYGYLYYAFLILIVVSVVAWGVKDLLSKDSDKVDVNEKQRRGGVVRGVLGVLLFLWSLVASFIITSFYGSGYVVLIVLGFLLVMLWGVIGGVEWFVGWLGRASKCSCQGLSLLLGGFSGVLEGGIEKVSEGMKVLSEVTISFLSWPVSVLSKKKDSKGGDEVGWLGSMKSFLSPLGSVFLFLFSVMTTFVVVVLCGVAYFLMIPLSLLLTILWGVVVSLGSFFGWFGEVAKQSSEKSVREVQEISAWLEGSVLQVGSSLGLLSEAIVGWLLWPVRLVKGGDNGLVEKGASILSGVRTYFFVGLYFLLVVGSISLPLLWGDPLSGFGLVDFCVELGSFAMPY